MVAALDTEGCDLVVHTGDAIGIGPHPAECLEALLDRPAMRFVMGNHDEWFAHGLPEPQPNWMSAEEWHHQRWTHQQLTPAMRQAVASWPDAISLDISGIQAILCHYPRAADGNGFAPIEKEPTAADLDRLVKGHDGDVVFYGHHHPRSDVQEHARFVNPGALGCNAPGEARFAVLTVQDDGTWDVSLRCVPYDPGNLLHDYVIRNVPARETILRTFHWSGR